MSNEIDFVIWVYLAYFVGRHLVNLLGFVRALRLRTSNESSLVTYDRWVDFYALVVGLANIVLLIVFLIFFSFEEIWGLIFFALLAGLTTWFIQRTMAIGIASILGELGKIQDSQRLIAHIRSTQPRMFVPVYYMRY